MSDETIAELFARDPLSFTKEGGEVDRIIEKMREARKHFNLGGKVMKTEKKVDLKDLGLL